jgi:hypothetical protein
MDKELMMQTPINTAFDGSFFQTHNLWNEVPTVSLWRWSFSDLPDASLKIEAADLIAKMLLGTDPATMSPEELLVLSMCSLATPAESYTEEPGIDFDA